MAETSSESSRANRVIGMIAHTELTSSDPVVTKDFLERVFGWQFQTLHSVQGDLIAYQTQGGSRGSIRKTAQKEPPASVSYVLVDDLAQTEKRIVGAGGEIILPRVDVPEMGSFFWFRIPRGPILACWQDLPK